MVWGYYLALAPRANTIYKESLDVAINAVNHFEETMLDSIGPKKEQPICPNCGSNQVVQDASVCFDVGLQDWVLNTIYDKGAACGECGEEISRFDMVEVPA